MAEESSKAQETLGVMLIGLAGVREKIKRADVHIGNLSTDNARFVQRSGCVVVEEFDPNTRKHTFRVRCRIPKIDPYFTIVLGESIYHLRTALDHLVHQLHVHESDRIGEPVCVSTQRGFPVFRNEPITDKQVSRFKGKVQKLSASAIADITDLQPWRVGPASATKDHTLVLLDDLHNGDKHRILTVLGGSVNLANYGIGAHPGMVGHIDVFDSRNFRQSMALEDGAEIGFYTGNEGVKVDVKTSASISFPEIGSSKFKPVVPLLQQLRDFVVATIDRFEADHLT